MNTTACLTRAVLAGAALTLAGIAPAHAVGDAENRPARMDGAGSVAADGGPHVSIALPCPGGDVGFNPQPDPPGHLHIRLGQSRFELDAVTAASCSNNLHEGTGTGTCGDVAGFVVDWSFVDGGHSASGDRDDRPDRVRVEISGDGDACAISFAGSLARGNLRFIGNPDIRPEVGTTSEER